MVMMGLVIVMGHNAFDFVEDDPGFQATLWWDFLHYGFLPPMKYCWDTMLCWSTPSGMDGCDAAGLWAGTVVCS